MISAYFLLPLVGADFMKTLPFLHIHHFFLHPNEKRSSVLSYLSFKSKVFPIQTSEAYEFYCIAVVRLFMCLAEIISGKQKAASFTAAENPQMMTRNTGREASEKDIVKDSKKKFTENKVTAKKKYFSLKKTIFLSHEKLS